VSDFFATAEVLVRPVTTGFRAELEAQVALATAKPIPVPVQVVPVTGGVTGAAAATTAASREVAAAMEVQGAAAVRTASATTALTRAETAAATAAQRLALAQSEVANAASAVGAAQIRASRSEAALTAAERSLTAARLSGNAARIRAAEGELALAVAQEREASTALVAARAQAAHAASLAQVSQGALASGLSLGGVRGATLAASKGFLIGTAAVVAFARGIQAAASLERELNVFRITAQATGEEMARVREEAVALGRDVSLPAVSAGDAAEAMTELVKAGLAVEDSLAGARGVLQLATAAQLDNAAATELAANALNAFGLAGDQATHVADLLANAANESQGSIADMGIALRQSAAVANQLGLSLDDTVALLTILARAGLSGSDAGTSLRVALTRLIAPTDKAANALGRLNVNLRDAQGNLRLDVFAQMGRAMEDLGRQERAQILFEIFGQDAQRAASILSTQGVPALEDTTAALGRQGAAAELAGARTEGFLGSLEGLSSELETVGTNLEFLLVPLTGVVSLFSALAEGVNIGFDAFRSFGREVDKQLEPVRGFFGSIKEASDTTDDFVGGLLGHVPGVKAFGDALGSIGGESAPQQIANIRSLSQSLSDIGSILAGDTKFLNEIITRLGRLPTDAEIVRIALDPSQANKVLNDLVEEARDKGTLSADALAEAFRRESQAASGRMTEPLRRGLSDFTEAAREEGRRAGEALIESFTQSQIRGQLQLQKTAVAQAQAFGETGLEELLAERDRIDRILNSRRRPVGPALESLLNERKAVNSQIESIEKEAAADRERAADEIVKARNEADQKFLKALSVREQARTNQVIKAQSDEDLKNDLEAQIALRNFYKRSIVEIRQTVRDAEARRDAIASATQDLIRAEQEVANLRQQLRVQRQRERQDRIRERQESLELDLQIAQATGSVAAQRRALQAEIKFFKERIRATREGSLQRKRWLLELRRAQAELRDLKKEAVKTKNAFAELSFEFLTAQQGFAANLFGNLIPTSFTGLVGTPSPSGPDLSRGVPQAAALKEAIGGGVTRGQGETQIEILKRQLAELQAIRLGRSHPEATFQKHQTAGAMETQ